MYHVTIYVRGVMHKYREGNSDLVIWHSGRGILCEDQLSCLIICMQRQER